MRRGRKPQREIVFEKVFEPALQERAKDFIRGDSRSSSLTRALLVVALLGGALAVGAVAPNIFQALGMNRSRRSKHLSEEGFKQLRRRFYYLQQQKLVEPVPGKSGLWQLTVAGRKTVSVVIDEDENTIPEPPYWDKKWRLIFFDVPDKKKAIREALRRELRMMGCFQFQKSVWVHPFPCAKEVLYTTTNLNAYAYVEVCTVEDFSNPRVLAFFRPLLEKHLS